MIPNMDNVICKEGKNDVNHKWDIERSTNCYPNCETEIFKCKPSWSSWSDWSTCSCDGCLQRGIRKRKRSCGLNSEEDKSNCFGITAESRTAVDVDDNCECDQSDDIMSVMLLGLGYRFNGIQLVDLETGEYCQPLPDFPHLRMFAVGAFINNSIIICGGFYNGTSVRQRPLARLKS